MDTNDLLYGGILLVIALLLIALAAALYIGIGYAVLWALAALGMIESYGLTKALAVAVLLWVATMIFSSD